jgi:hypothetical protein
MRENQVSNSKIPIEPIHNGLLIIVSLSILVKFFDLFTIPNWIFGPILILTIISFFFDAMRQRKKKI